MRVHNGHDLERRNARPCAEPRPSSSRVRLSPLITVSAPTLLLPTQFHTGTHQAGPLWVASASVPSRRHARRVLCAFSSALEGPRAVQLPPSFQGRSNRVQRREAGQ